MAKKIRIKNDRLSALSAELIRIIGTGNYPLVQEFILKHKRVECIINMHSYEKGTAMLNATRFLRVKIVHLLLQHGAEVNVRNKNGYTPLLYAAWHGKEKLLIMLLKHGADITAKAKTSYGADITAKAKTSYDAFDFAEKFNHNHILNILNTVKTYGVSVLPDIDVSNEPSYDIRQLSLVENVRVREETKKAVWENDLETVEKNLSLYEGLADYQGDPLWGPLILLAAQRGFVPMTSLLIDMGEYMNGYHHGCFYAFSPFSVALKNNHFDVCTLLITRGVITIEKEMDLIKMLKGEQSEAGQKLRGALIAREVMRALSGRH